MTDPRAALKKLVERARRWAFLRAKYRKLLDSKSADEKDLEKIKKTLLLETDKLERAILLFEKAYRRFLLTSGKDLKQKGSFPWKEVLGVIATGAGALEKAMHPGAPPHKDENVIDVEAEVID